MLPSSSFSLSVRGALYLPLRIVDRISILITSTPASMKQKIARTRLRRRYCDPRLVSRVS